MNRPQISVRIPTVLRKYCDGNPNFMLTAANPQAVLDQLEQNYPDLYYCVCDESGSIRRHVHLFVNSDLIREKDELLRPLCAGDEVGIFQAVSGG